MDKYEAYDAINDIIKDFDMDSIFAILCNLKATFILNLEPITHQNYDQLLTHFQNEVHRIVREHHKNDISILK